MLHTERGSIELDDDCPQKGSSQPGCLLVVFSDLECPACALLSGDIDALMHEGARVRMYYRHFPLHRHPRAHRLAVLSQAVWMASGPAQFWKTHAAILRNPPGDDQEPEAWLAEQGLSIPNLRQVMPTAEVRVNADRKLGERLGLQATPALFINGSLIPGRIPYDQLAAIVREQGG